MAKKGKILWGSCQETKSFYAAGVPTIRHLGGRHFDMKYIFSISAINKSFIYYTLIRHSTSHRIQ